MMGSLQAMYILTEIVSKRLKKMVNQEVYETLLYMLQQDLSELHEE